MTAADEPGRRSVVTALWRSPVRQATLVRAGAQYTFGSFVTTVGAWWPVLPFSAGKDRVRNVTIDHREGGRVYETWDDGTEVGWGTITAWEPPRRFVLTWDGTPVPTEVEFTFTALGPGLTRVAVEHRGWDALTEEQLAQDCAQHGGYTSGAYAAGWATILQHAAEAIAGSSRPLADRPRSRIAARGSCRRSPEGPVMPSRSADQHRPSRRRPASRIMADTARRPAVVKPGKECDR